MVVIFHKHIVLSVKLRKSERMNVSHKIPTGTGTAYSSVPVLVPVVQLYRTGTGTFFYIVNQFVG